MPFSFFLWYFLICSLKFWNLMLCVFNFFSKTAAWIAAIYGSLESQFYCLIWEERDMPPFLLFIIVGWIIWTCLWRFENFFPSFPSFFLKATGWIAAKHCSFRIPQCMKLVQEPESLNLCSCIFHFLFDGVIFSVSFLYWKQRQSLESFLTVDN